MGVKGEEGVGGGVGGVGEGDGSATRGRLRTAPRVAVFFSYWSSVFTAEG